MSNNIALKEDFTEDVKENILYESNVNIKSSTVHVKFKGTSDQILIQSQATGEKSKVAAANKKLRLIHSRIYFIPVDKNIDSDNYGNIKQYSETSDKFEVLYVKNGYACINPILHNALIEDNQRLCIIW